MLLSDHSNLVDSCREGASKIYSDPRVQLDSVNMEIAVKRAMAYKLLEEVAGLMAKRRELIRKILE